MFLKVTGERVTVLYGTDTGLMESLGAGISGIYMSMVTLPFTRSVPLNKKKYNVYI